MVGPRGPGGFSALLLGSVALEVAGHTGGPVIEGTTDRTAGRMVVGVGQAIGPGDRIIGVDPVEAMLAVPSAG